MRLQRPSNEPELPVPQGMRLVETRNRLGFVTRLYRTGRPRVFVPAVPDNAAIFEQFP